MFSKMGFKLNQFILVSGINYSAFMIGIMYCLVIYFFISFLQDYSNTFVHPDYYRYILPESLRDGLDIGWKDVINTLQLRSPGEFRPRFLAYGIQTLDQKIRLYSYSYFLIPPTMAPIAWFLQLIVGPYYLFRGILNLTGDRQAAALSLIVYLTSIGFLSGFTMGLLQGKTLSNVFLIVSFYLMTGVNKQLDESKLFYESPGVKKYVLLSVMFFGLFIDELPIFVFVFLPLMFTHLFFPKLNCSTNVKRFIKNGLFFCISGVLFLAVVLFIIPVLTRKYFGFEFDYLGNTLALGKNTRGAVSFLQGPYAKFSFMLVLQNLLTMFGLSVVPWQISQLTPSGYGDYYGGQINNFAKILILLFYLVSIVILTSYTKRIKRPLIGFLIAFILFMLFLTVLLIRHIPIATGYYYGAPFAVFFSILIGIYHYTTFQFPKRIRSISVGVILAIVAIQIDNFIPINHGWIKTHNEDISRPSFANELALSPPGPVTKSELREIWQAWKQGTLEKYLQEHKISSGAIYLVFELRMLDQVKHDGFAKPIDWRV